MLTQESQDVPDEEETIQEQPSTDESIVHWAIGILRRRMKNVTELENEYHSSEEMSCEASQQHKDPLIKMAVMWLTNENSYNNVDDVTDYTELGYF